MDEQRIDQCLRRDRRRLRRQLREATDESLHRVLEAAQRSRERREVRRRNLPQPAFPPDLPVSVARERIAAAIRDHPVVVVCGETGSGKTTQLPKICLALGFGVDGFIGHTQPRRVAARTVAARIAAELGSSPGRLAGHKVRFDDRVDDDAYIKVMTDGLLLAEVAHDPDLAAYDVMIVDEAHERSLNIDLLLGYLKRLLTRRRDLRVILSSASIDTARFAAHFDGAPVIEVSGRSWPVEVRWRPAAGGGPDAAIAARVADGVREAIADGDGDVLVFVPGERDIRDCAASLRRLLPVAIEILPLYARLAARRQDLVFAPHAGRRVIIATNVAETSITVPGVRYVVDTGLARIGRWSYRSRVQRLPVEAISQASAEQRKGRCGRIAAGVCIRLYDEAGFAARPRFTDPEIVRANLAGVILQMKSLGLGDIEGFPLMDPPDPRLVRDGHRLLSELGALDERRRISKVGRRMARFPVDPRAARVLLATAERGCLAEGLVIAAALSVPDARERPQEAREAAAKAHAAFADRRSDFMGYLRLWQAYHQRLREASRRELEQWAREHFLSALRLREWREVHGQLQEVAAGMGLTKADAPARPADIHRALLAGYMDLVGHLGTDGDYRGLQGRRFTIAPGSSLAKAKARWIVAAELVDAHRGSGAGRAFAVTVAGIEPRWLEQAAGHALRRQWVEVGFDVVSGEVVGWQSVHFGSLTLATRRRGWFGREIPAEAHAVFVREALAEGAMEPLPEWARHNLSAVRLRLELASRARRESPIDPGDWLACFYSRHLPADVHDVATLKDWLVASPGADDRLRLCDAELEDLAPAIGAQMFPDVANAGGARVPLGYRHAPGEADDGVTARIPLPMLNQLREAAFTWLVPGLREQKVVALLRCLPGQQRRNFVPASEAARAFLDAAAADGSVTSGAALANVLAAWLRLRAGEGISESALEAAEAGRDPRFPLHLRMRFEVLDEDGHVLAGSRTLATLQARFGEQAARSFSRLGAGAAFEREQVGNWDFGTLPEHLDVHTGAAVVRGFPALVDTGSSVALRLLDDAARAATSHRDGLLRLFRARLPRDLRHAMQRPPERAELLLLYSVLEPVPVPLDRLLPVGAATRDPLDAVSRRVLTRLCLCQGDVRDAATFAARLEACKQRLWSEFATTLARTVDILREHSSFLSARRAAARVADDARLADLDLQVACLVYRGFLECTPDERFADLLRYLRAATLRARRLPDAPGRDHDRTRQVAPFFVAWQARLHEHLARGLRDPELERFRWQLEELRVSLFAQELGTLEPVSTQRLERQWRLVAA